MARYKHLLQIIKDGRPHDEQILAIYNMDDFNQVHRCFMMTLIYYDRTLDGSDNRHFLYDADEGEILISATKRRISDQETTVDLHRIYGK
jgi:hypothetical protein